MKIAYITTYNAQEIGNWSGLGYYIGKTLKENSKEIYYIGSLKNKYELLFKIKTKFIKYLYNQSYLKDRSPVMLKGYAKQATMQLSNLNADVIFSPGTLPIAYLETNKPVVFWADATFTGMVNFYQTFSNLCKETLENGYKTERLALEKCRLAIYSSDWAAQSAIKYYNIDEDKVKVVPFGANIDYYPSLEEVKKLIDSRGQKMCKLLFLGVDWQRKGGEIAYKVADKLNNMGINTELAIAGCNPDLNCKETRFVKLYGFLRKSERKESGILTNLISQSHFVILPTQAEAYGLVFCEANAFGVPCIASDVGGITTIIKNELNGKTFSKDSNIDKYCEYIASLMTNYSYYKKLALSAYNEFTTRLNWGVAGKTVRKLLEGIIK